MISTIRNAGKPNSLSLRGWRSHFSAPTPQAGGSQEATAAQGSPEAWLSGRVSELFLSPTQKPLTSRSRSLREDHLPADSSPSQWQAITPWRNMSTRMAVLHGDQTPCCCFLERKMTLHHVFQQFIHTIVYLPLKASIWRSLIYLVLLFFHMVKPWSSPNSHKGQCFKIYAHTRITESNVQSSGKTSAWMFLKWQKITIQGWTL